MKIIDNLEELDFNPNQMKVYSKNVVFRCPQKIEAQKKAQDNKTTLSEVLNNFINKWLLK